MPAQGCSTTCTGGTSTGWSEANFVPPLFPGAHKQPSCTSCFVNLLAFRQRGGSSRLGLGLSGCGRYLRDRHGSAEDMHFSDCRDSFSSVLPGREQNCPEGQGFPQGR